MRWLFGDTRAEEARTPMADDSVSPIWVERVIEKHHGPAAEVEAHLRALGLDEAAVAEALAAWAERHGVSLEGGPAGSRDDTE
jgi:hypothetical protein